MFIPAYLIRPVIDILSEQDDLELETRIVPVKPDMVYDWLCVLTEYTTLAPIMRPHRVVYSAPLRASREEPLKVRVQGVVAERRLTTGVIDLKSV